MIKPKFKKIIYFFVIFISLISLGITAYLVINKFVVIPSRQPIIKGIKEETQKNDSNPISIVEYSLTNYKNDDDPSNDYKDEVFFLGEEGRELLINKIKKDLSFGPEVEQIKGIYINRGPDFTDEEVKGQYSPNTGEIDINVKSFVYKMNHLERFSIKDRVNLIFPTIYHEYYHHFSFSFLHSNNEMKSLTSLERSYVPTNFLNKWKEYLNYDKNYKINHYSNKNDLNAFYSTKEIFDIANTNKLKFDDAQEYSLLPDISTDFNSNDLKYNFSFEELFTRKWQEISYTVSPIINQDKSYWYGVNQPLDSRLLNINSFAIELYKNKSFGDESYSNVVPQDLEKAKEGWNHNDNRLLDNPYGGKYRNENNNEEILENNVDELGNLYVELSGYGSPISQIYEKNDNVLINQNWVNWNSSENSVEEVKISGFVRADDYNSFEKIRINGTEFEIYKPEYKYSNLKYKANPFENNFSSKVDYVPYITKDYKKIDFDKDNQKIEFYFKNKGWEIINKQNSNSFYANQTKETLNIRNISSFNIYYNKSSYYKLSNKNIQNNEYDFVISKW